MNKFTRYLQFAWNPRSKRFKHEPVPRLMTQHGKAVLIGGATVPLRITGETKYLCNGFGDRLSDYRVFRQANASLNEAKDEMIRKVFAEGVEYGGTQFSPAQVYVIRWEDPVITHEGQEADVAVFSLKEHFGW